MLRQNPNADLPGRNADDKGENDRSLTTSDTKTRPLNQASLSDRVSANTHKASAYLLNAARRRVVDERALVDALAPRLIRAQRSTSWSRSRSPLLAMEHLLITPHTAGETFCYEDNLLAIMQEPLNEAKRSPLWHH